MRPRAAAAVASCGRSTAWRDLGTGCARAALIALLLLRWLHHLSRAAWSLSNLTTMLRLNLFTYRELMQWLHDPFGTPPDLPEAGAPVQLTLDFGQALT